VELISKLSPKLDRLDPAGQPPLARPGLPADKGDLDPVCIDPAHEAPRCVSGIGGASGLFLPNANLPSGLTDQAMLSGKIPHFSMTEFKY
jgi:hypothetical protein